jgi:hypothetical protein
MACLRGCGTTRQKYDVSRWFYQAPGTSGSLQANLCEPWATSTNGEALFNRLRCPGGTMTSVSEEKARAMFVSIIIDCAEAALSYPKTCAALGEDPRPGQAIAVARAWLAGAATPEQIEGASKAMIDLCGEVVDPDALLACIAVQRAVGEIRSASICPPIDLMSLPGAFTEDEVNVARAFQAGVVRKHAAAFGVEPR